jgi:choline dehydrogenase-like flavoprotein
VRTGSPRIWLKADARRRSISGLQFSGAATSGTCKLGTDEMSVVDPECRVQGMQGIRVVDSSIIPSITSGNLNAPSIMIGEKAADHILGKIPV